MDSLRGQLLIAGPALEDPNFRRAVVLIAAHDEEGAMGLVLNRPTPLVVSEAVPRLGDLAGEDSSVYAGGPVQPNSVVVLAEFDDPRRAGLLVDGRMGFLPADAELDELADLELGRVRVYAGHAGWAGGQLEEEMAEEAWIVASTEPDEVFAEAAGDLWPAVLRRMGGRYALIARMPDDPSVN